MIKSGVIRLNGAAARAGASIRAGDTVEIKAPPTPLPSAAIAAGAPEIEILFADGEIIVVNKPIGMAVHPAPGHPGGTLVDALLARFPELAQMIDPDGVARPGIVHRLDKETSGVMVVARTPFARTSLSRQFKERTVGKTYVAIVRGIVSRDRITISKPIGRHPVDRKRMSIRSHSARDAITHLSVLARLDEPEDRRELWSTLLLARPQTGRTHQIRVHLASIGHPCLGDPVYGGRARSASRLRAPAGGARTPSPVPSQRAQNLALEATGFERQALHALALSIDHPRSGARLKFVAPLPDDFRAFLAARGIASEPDDVRRWIG